jgi:hypothetical protein
VFVAIWFCGAFGIAVIGSESEALNAAFAFCLFCLFLILYIIFGLGALVVYTRYASTDQMDVGLEYAKIFQLVGQYLGPLLTIVILVLIVGIAGALFGVFTLGILFMILPAYFSLVVAYFGAQLSRLPGFSQ